MTRNCDFVGYGDGAKNGLVSTNWHDNNCNAHAVANFEFESLPSEMRSFTSEIRKYSICLYHMRTWLFTKLNNDDRLGRIVVLPNNKEIERELFIAKIGVQEADD